MRSVRRVVLAVLLGLAVVGCTQPSGGSAPADATPGAATPTPAPTEDYSY